MSPGQRMAIITDAVAAMRRSTADKFEYRITYDEKRSACEVWVSFDGKPERMRHRIVFPRRCDTIDGLRDHEYGLVGRDYECGVHLAVGYAIGRASTMADDDEDAVVDYEMQP